MKLLIKRNQKWILLFLIPSVLGYVIFSLIPMIATVYLGFSSWDVISGAPELIGFENYIKVFTTKEFYEVLGNTLRYIVTYIPLMLVLSFLIAILFNTEGKWNTLFRVMLFIPVLTSWVAGAMIWRTALSSQYGLVNNILKLVGIVGPSWLTDPKWAMIAISLVSVWKDLGFFALILFGGLRGIDKSIVEASKVDGANRFQVFRHITFPMVTPTLFFVLVTAIINSFQLFPQVMVMTQGGPLGSTQVMVERIYTYGFRYYQMGYATALAVILFAIILSITLVQMILQKKWVYYE
ncbi:MAG: sugar ABC transporter permease [Vallitaleaceae bacterium]|nr:sugar ABC transporter permease [Vallitaleaceae bacterium]